MPALNAAFFDAVRPLFGGSLSQSQVDGLTFIALAWDTHGDRDRAKLAYVLATAFHETGQTMQPVKETQFTDVVPSDAKVKERLTKAWKAGKLKGVKRDYWSGGYFGRGYVQLTHAANYQKASDKLGIDLITKPERALDPGTSARILVVGMMEGWFTGKKLGDYVGDGVDFENARRIVNGTDKAAHIAMLANSFLRALEATPAPEAPTAPETPPTGLAGLLSVLIKLIVSIFTRGRK
jgi:putative chitinase